MELKEVLLKRRSIRKFKEDKISKEIIDELMHAAMSGPSACNKKPWEFYIITNEDLLSKVRKTTLFSRMNAPLAIVVCGNMHHALPLEMKDFWIQDCSAATENILLRVTDLGLGAVWCGITPMKKSVKKIQEVLNLEEKIVPLNIIWVGYPNEKVEERDQYDEKRVHYL